VALARGVLRREVVLALAALLLATLPDAAPEAAEALRALARITAGDPSVEDVQRAAAAQAGLDPERLRSWESRPRSSAWLPHLSLQASRTQRDTRVVGVSGTLESDYLRQTPGFEVGLRASWELDRLLFAREEVNAAWTASRLRETRDERVRRATRLHFQRRRLLLQLAVEPPREPLARAEREVQVEEITAELDALTGGLLSGRRKR